MVIMCCWLIAVVAGLTLPDSWIGRTEQPTWPHADALLAKAEGVCLEVTKWADGNIVLLGLAQPAHLLCVSTAAAVLAPYTMACALWTIVLPIGYTTNDVVISLTSATRMLIIVSVFGATSVLFTNTNT